jgi:hypothetical protein
MGIRDREPCRVGKHSNTIIEHGRSVESELAEETEEDEDEDDENNEN